MIASGFAPPDPALLAESLATALQRLVRQRPRATALVLEDREISFAALWRRVEALAAQIRDAGAAPGPVALLLAPGVASVAAWFAAGLAGRPLLLLEPGNPPERNAALMAKAGASILLHNLPPPEAPALRLRPGPVPETDPGPFAPLPPEAPAMLFPTSGSTGAPKLITYAATTLQAKLRASQGLMGVEAGERVLIAGSHANYGFLHHALVFLLAGGALCLADIKAQGLPGVFEAIRTRGVRHLRFTPSLFRLAAARPEGAEAMALLRGLRFSGEPLLASDLELARRVAPRARIQNVYGSTESALFVWTDRGQALAPGTVPIGRIYPLSAFTLLDEDGAPAGEGELVIHSEHHALGDWQQGALDRSRFGPGGRVYATGDVARLTPEGEVMILGRKDRVVKINGQRVSLDEIEGLITAQPGVEQAAVLVDEAAHGNRLVAFLVGEGDPLPALSRALPAHMIPARVLRRPALPLLPGGKTDRKALLASLSPTGAEAAPASGLGGLMARILRLPEVGRDADFFSLGGDSLLALDLQLQAEALTGRRFALRDFLREPTLRGLERLTLASPAVLQVPERVEIAFRQIRPGEGAVLVMPGQAGGAGVETWEASGAVPATHALWACDARFPKGMAADHFNWREVLALAAEAIDKGKAPAPSLTVGYSIGGYMAWGLARLLPELGARVAMIDAQALHRYARFSRPDWQPQTLPGPLPQVLHLHRATAPGLALPLDARRIWPGEVLHRAAPTLDHIEMGRIDVMTHLAPVLAAFARGEPLPAIPSRGLTTMGARLLTAWTSGASPAEASALLAERTRHRGINARLALLVLGLLRAPLADVRAFLTHETQAPFRTAAGLLDQIRTDPAPCPDWPPFDPARPLPADRPETLVAALALRGARVYLPPPAVSDPPRVSQ